ncbi:MAG: S9 family peptidase [Bacteroidetes bacterium B1(2017)]|nr:MAG: S9 family peptidase [Bacteroidetes bacterium B1(2017)]
MRKSVLLLSISLLLGVKFGFAQKDISLEDIWTKGTFAAKGVAGFNSMNDGRYYCNLDERQNLLRFEFASGKLVDTLIRNADVKQANGGEAIDLSSFSWSADESKLIIATQTEYIYRHSSKSVFYIYDLTSKKLVKPVAEKVRYATLSADNSKMAFVRNNDLYYFDFRSNSEVRISKDGKENAIINGATDWVYEEEFAIWRGFAWSPNSDKIAYYRFDETKVPEYEMAVYGTLYPNQSKFKYPKAGEVNSVVNIYVFDTKSELISEMQTGSETDMYLPRMQWTTSNNTLCIQRLNRLQNKLELLLADAASGKSNVILTENNPYYVDITDNLTFLKDGKTFLLSSERDGYNHIYLFDMKGKLVKQLTKGAFDVDDVFGVDEKNKKLYFSSSEVNAAERYVYSIGLNGKDKKMLSTGKGWHSASFNNDFTFYLDVVSTINTPPVYSLLNAQGKLVRTLEDNKALLAKLKDYKINEISFSTIKNELGQDMNQFTLLPINFDATKKYPVLMYVYGGPGSQTVMNRWSGGNYFWYQMLAQKGYIIVSIDGRGTGFKGEQFKKCTYLNLGKFEIEDQLFAAKQLAKLPYVDATRMGIWGWSFGGYMAGLGISKGNDIFKSAISVAPVTNWRYYDNIYTERFMRTPAENGKNYDDNSPINHVEKIKGNYLIIHGTADDNVHFQNTVEMVDAMIKKSVKFDSEFYPNKNHGIGGSRTRLHLYDRMTNFILEKL